MSDGQPDNKWHLDRRVPIAFIFAIAVQTIGAFWWAAKVDAKMEEYERRITAAEMSARESAKAGQEVTNRLSAIEAVLKGQADTLNDIRAALWGRQQPRP